MSEHLDREARRVRDDSARREGASGLAATLLTLGILGGVAFAALYALGPEGPTGDALVQWLGIALAVAAGGIGAGLVVWARALMPHGPETQERHFPGDDPDERRAAVGTLRGGAREPARRRLLGRLLLTAFGALGLGALFPLRSLARDPFPERLETGWRPGLRLVDELGHPIRAEDVQEGSALTVFPEAHVREADSQTILVRVPRGIVERHETATGLSPDGFLAYSKLCTHLGCPVGLYETETQRLLCPCHQSAFDVLDGAKPLFGPATRPLPGLPLEIDDDGFLVAADGFDRPVGPGFWSFPSHVRDDR